MILSNRLHTISDTPLEFVLAIPQILEKAGYTVIELRPLKD